MSDTLVNAWIVWGVLWLFGAASLARFVNSDSLFTPVRRRWEIHWECAYDKVMRRCYAALGEHWPPRGDPAQVRASLEQVRITIMERASVEPGVPLWTIGSRRADRRPWSTVNDKLGRIAVYGHVLSCPWCASVWIFAAVAVWIWGQVYRFGDPFRPAALPADVWLPLLVLAARWVYGLVKIRLDED